MIFCKFQIHTNTELNRVSSKEDGTTEGGWWYKSTEVVNCKKCIGCDSFRAEDEFDFKQWQSKSGLCCNECKGQNDVKRRRTTDKLSRRSSRNKNKFMNYTES
jgi:hypothetical protein